MIWLSFFLIFVGGTMLWKPEFIWRILESWKSKDAEEPSSMYVWSVRVGGVLFALVGLANAAVNLYK